LETNVDPVLKSILKIPELALAIGLAIVAVIHVWKYVAREFKDLRRESWKKKRVHTVVKH